MSRSHAFSFEYLEPRQMLAAHVLTPGLVAAGVGANISSSLSSTGSLGTTVNGSGQNGSGQQALDLLTSLRDASNPGVHGSLFYTSSHRYW